MSTAPRRLGKYELLQPVGKGHLGDVWKARDLALHRDDIALKILHGDLQADPHFLNRFTVSSADLIALQHQNIVKVHEAQISRDPISQETTAYLAMDYIDGYTLDDYLQVTSRRGTFPAIEGLLYLFTQLGTALAYAHSNQVIHGNLRPGKIRLNSQQRTFFTAGEPMIADLGLDAIAGDTARHGSTNPMYLSPEQAQGQPAQKESDIYALGIILYETCTGAVPFRDENAFTILMHHIKTLPTPPTLLNPNIPTALSSVILRALAKDPVARFASATQLVAAITEACSNQSLTPLANIPQMPEQPQPQGRMISILGVSQPQITNQPIGTYQSAYPMETLTPPALPINNILLNETQQPATGSSSPANIQASQPATTPPLPEVTATQQPEQAIPNGPLSEGGITPLPPRSISLAGTKGSLIKKPSINSTQRLPEQVEEDKIPTEMYLPDSSDISYPPEVMQPLMDEATSPYQAMVQEPPAQPYFQEPPAQPYFQEPPSEPYFQGPPSEPYFQGQQAEAYLQQPPETPIQPTPPVARQGFFKQTRNKILAIAVVIILIAGSGIGILLIHGQSNTTAQGTAAGHIFFQDDALGYNDEIRIEIPSINTPASGQVYMAWSQDSQNTSILLGTITINAGEGTLLYQGDSKHSNLLGSVAKVIITSEDSASKPTQPGNQIVYQGAFDPAILQIVREILYQSPQIPDKGDLAAEMFETIKDMNDKAVSVVDSYQNTHDYALAQRQETRIIQMIDGTPYASTSGDLPANIGSQLAAPVGLLSSPKQVGYVDALANDLTQLKSAAADNPTVLNHISNVNIAITNLHTWLGQMRTNDIQLLKSGSSTQASNVNTALQIKALAADTYIGKTIPPNVAPNLTVGSEGAVQAYTETQYLATLDLQNV